MCAQAPANLAVDLKQASSSSLACPPPPPRERDVSCSSPTPHLQGVLSAQDAVLAVQAGASGVIVSNHGGRALDGSLSSIESLGPVVKVRSVLSIQKLPCHSMRQTRLLLLSRWWCAANGGRLSGNRFCPPVFRFRPLRKTRGQVGITLQFKATRIGNCARNVGSSVSNPSVFSPPFNLLKHALDARR